MLLALHIVLIVLWLARRNGSKLESFVERSCAKFVHPDLCI